MNIFKSNKRIKTEITNDCMSDASISAEKDNEIGRSYTSKTKMSDTKGAKCTNKTQTPRIIIPKPPPDAARVQYIVIFKPDSDKSESKDPIHESKNIDSEGNEVKLNIESFKCPTCHKELLDKSSYESHIQSHNNYFQCSSCPYYCYTSEEELKNHEAIHTSPGFFQCSNCKFKCTVETSMVYHRKFHEIIPLRNTY